MADKGPGPQELVRKRITTEIMRLQFQIESQELEIMETHDKLQRLQENIDASHEAIKQQELNLEALEKGSEDG